MAILHGALYRAEGASSALRVKLKKIECSDLH